MIMVPFKSRMANGFFQNILKVTFRDIESMENNRVAQTSKSELEDYFISRARLEPLKLHPEQRYVKDQTAIRLSEGGEALPIDSGFAPCTISGTRLRVAVPFDGERKLWHLQPTGYDPEPCPEIEIGGREIILTFEFPDNQANRLRLRKKIADATERLIEPLAHLRTEVDHHNKTLPSLISEALETKWKRAVAVHGTVARLGIPLKRNGSELSLTLPVSRRRRPVTLPAPSPDLYRPEPVLLEAEYEYILSVIRNMAVTMERAPKAFAHLNEEAIRQHFLVQLNGHFCGTATGETFNANGKTDILIRYGNRNVFIAECKFWRGPSGFSDTISQLLGYLSWRDSKAALLIFHRNQTNQKDEDQITAVGKKMHERMTTHPGYRKTLSVSANGEGRYVFTKDSDEDRAITIATMLFMIPDTRKLSQSRQLSRISA